jgi:mannosyltransferase OCH1-like enzyme
MDIKIHQLWINEKIPEIPKLYPKEWRNKWEEEYKEKYKLWNTEDIRNLINAHFPWIKNEFWSWPANYQADVSRLLILYQHGGAYVDLDCIFIKRFDYLFENKVAKGIPNHFLIFERNDTLLHTIINQIYENILQNKQKDKICKTCGPVAIHAIIQKHKDKFIVLSDYEFNNLGKNFRKVSDNKINKIYCSDNNVCIIHQYLKGWSKVI